ncbi:DNA recombination protein RmuC [Paraflavisolibacter sp. H34]|uniref:DNA recombination protein RmuC n=1 Tax=Huijunlia imazamoxiresistens TaxID=3127457 RepID=UPI003018D4EF
MQVILLVLCGLVLVAIALIYQFRPRPNNNLFVLSTKLDTLFGALDKISANLREDFKANREESAALAKENRRELNDTLLVFKSEMAGTLRAITEQNARAAELVNRTLEEKISALVDKVEANNRANRDTITASLKEFSLDQRLKFDELKAEQKELATRTLLQLEKITAKVEERLTHMNEQAKTDGHLMRQTLEASFKGFRETFTQSVESMNGLQREKFGQLEARQAELVQKTEEKLEKMRETVDEKLQKTLNERLGQSFELVSNQLEKVQKGLGEMQTLAQDVGGLKRVLSNVKMRGGFGEVQLEMLLENVLAPDQYEANVKTKAGSSDNVEFAIKFPNRDGDRQYVWLPIDAKFPREPYEYLQNAYEAGDPVAVEAAQKLLEAAIRKMARDICDKYLDPPNTTDFAIMFLPFEGIYAEVVRKASLLEEIQRQCKVVITGPTTLAAILNSLQMGFRTLAIQRRSSEVWSTLGAVKKEFQNFAGLLQKAQHNIQTGLNQLEDVVGVRTRAIQRKLKSVEALSDSEAKALLPEGEIVEEEE